MKNITRTALCLFFIFLFSNIHAQKTTAPQTISSQPFSIGETVEFHSASLNENRKLNIYLPYYYQEDSTKNYPVIYLLDGSADEDFIHIAGLVQFGSFSWINMIPESIVVGISNIDRKRDFTFPTKNEQDKIDFPTTGGSANFINFMEKELPAYVQNNYRTNDTTTIIGQSLGGLLATEILFKKPGLFENYIIVSPSLWWDDESLLKSELKNIEPVQSIYIAVGKEGPVMERTAKELYEKIKEKNQKKENLYFDYFDGQDHANILHLAVYQAFETIFEAEKKE